MKFRWILLFSALLMLAAQPALAQGDASTEISNNPNPDSIVIQDVVAGGAQDAVTLTITGQQTDGCDYPLATEITREAGIVYVDVNRDETAMDTACHSDAAPFELAVELGDFSDVLSPSDNPVLAVGDNYVGQLTVMVETFAPATEPFVPNVTPLVLYPVSVETMTAVIAESNPPQTIFTIKGAYGTGCEVPTYIRQMVDETTKQIEIRIFQVMDAAQACPAILRLYEGNITLTETLSGTYELYMNGIRFIYAADTQSLYSEGELMRLPTVIETVDVLVMESFPPQLSLQVTGYQSDGCDFPAQVETRRDADTNTVYVQIFREMPLAVSCLATTIPYEASINLGAFDPGSYTIIVNDVEKHIDL